MSSTCVKSVISFSGSGIEATTKSCTCSKRYLMQLLKYSVINIMYRRIQLPEEDFEKDGVKDIKFMRCKASSKHPLIYKFYEWMKGAKDALEKDYLKEFYLLFKNTDGVLMEFYKFSFYYNFNDVEKENRVDPKILYEDTKKIFKDIKCLSIYKKWDENNHFTAMIKYNDNVSEFYQPPYFVTSSPTEESDEDEREIKKIQERHKLFSVTTGFHSLKSVFGADSSLKQIMNSPTPSSANSVITSSTTSKLLAEGEEKRKQDNKNEKQAVPVKIISSPKASSSTSSSSSETIIDDDENNSAASAYCICQTSINHKALEIVHCTLCKKPFHSVCFGFLKAPTGNFKCVTCGGSTNISAISETDQTNQKEFIHMRLLIGFCKLTMEGPEKIMKGFPNKEEREKLWKNLLVLRVITKRNEKYIVNRANMLDTNLLKTMFLNVDEDSMEMVDLTEEDEQSPGQIAKKAKHQ